MALEKRKFGKTGYDVSVLGFGGGPIGFLESEQETVTRILNYLLDSGVNLIDTAVSYVGSQAAIGKAIGSRRGEYVLVSKCGNTGADEAYPAWSRQLILRAIDHTLADLKTDHLDVMLLHTCPLEILERGEALGALVEARAAGKIRFAGYSGDNDAATYATSLRDIAVIETSINIADHANLEGVVPEAIKNGIGIIAKRPIANAAWRQPEEQSGLYRGYAQEYHDRLKALEISPADYGISGENAWPELALRFTLSQPGIHSAIIGTTNPDNVRANIAIAEKGPLPTNAVAKLRQAFTACSGGVWVAQG